MAKKHIDKKDIGDEISKNVAVFFEETKDKISQLSRTLLLGKSNLKPEQWYRYQIMHSKDFETQTRLIINQSYKNVSKALKSIDKELMTSTQAKETLNTLKQGFNELNASVINQHMQSYTEIYQKVIHSNVEDNLYQMIAQKVQSNATLGYIKTVDGKNYHWESWMERKVRTDIQQDISENLVVSGDDSGVVFYTTSCYGNCAPDHSDFQGKIYVTENWESTAPNDKKEAISEYIQAHDIKTIQSVMNGEPYLTTRPNCRHYFMPMPIDEVLECSTNKDVEKLRDKYELNFAGKYKPEKYEALQKQRYLERKIRSADEGVAIGKDLLSKATTKEEKIKANSIISREKEKINDSRKEIKTLVDNNEGNLFRAYKREHYNSIRGLNK